MSRAWEINRRPESATAEEPRNLSDHPSIAASEISPGESVGLKAHENTFAVIMASAMGFCVTPQLTNHAIK